MVKTKHMKIAKDPAPGWKGGFAASHEQFAYPDPEMLYDPKDNQIPLTHNMKYVDKLERSMRVLWPEFSWLVDPEDEESRVFNRFASDISRFGYTNEGRVYSVICPQQGAYTSVGCFNNEVTVKRSRGWINETNAEKPLYGEIETMGQLWFSKPRKSDKKHFPHHKRFMQLCKAMKKKRPGYALPFDKKNSIKIRLRNPENPNSQILKIRAGQCPHFESIKEADHSAEAWQVGWVSVKIEGVILTGDSLVDGFNNLIYDIFNFSKGNILGKGHTLTWNVWFQAPTLVNQQEWRNHAERWRKSIDEGHGSPSQLKEGAFYNVKGEKINISEAMIKEIFDKTLGKIGKDIEKDLKHWFTKSR